MEDSILKSTKKLLGIGDDDESFDLDIITHINSAFSNLHDLGVGPLSGFVIEDAEPKWTDFLPDEPEENKVKLARAKQVIFLRVRLAFDPPTNPPLLTAMQEQLTEAEWRLNVNREETEWADPSPPVVILP
jgi:hypothetical protein